jgi:F-type H+-transporting ATPase subunit epsilon
MQTTVMHLKILLPFRIFADHWNVTRIVAESRRGSYGLLPHRLDCVLALAPGIFVFETPELGEVYVALDEGLLVKAGSEVLVSVRNAIGGASLGKLREAIDREFLNYNAQEINLRSALAKLESEFIRRYMHIQQG